MTPRTLIWASVILQVFGLAFDVAWHALHPGFKPVTAEEMAAHLTTVHLPIYIGVAAVLVSTAWALIDQLRRSRAGIAVPVAFAGAVVQAVGEAWHAYTHLQLSTHAGPLAFTLSLFGLIVVIAALVLSGRRGRSPMTPRHLFSGGR